MAYVLQFKSIRGAFGTPYQIATNERGTDELLGPFVQQLLRMSTCPVSKQAKVSKLCPSVLHVHYGNHKPFVSPDLIVAIPLSFVKCPVDGGCGHVVVYSVIELINQLWSAKQKNDIICGHINKWGSI